MTTDLSNLELDELSKRKDRSDEVYYHEVDALISMARRCLSAEERLEKLLGNPEGYSNASGEETPVGTDAPPVATCQHRRCHTWRGVREYVRKRSDEESIEDFEYWRDVPIVLCANHAGNHEPHNR